MADLLVASKAELCTPEQLASHADFERFKGVMYTSDGWWMLNAVQGTLTLLETEPADESRLEVISRTLDPDDLDHQLRAACFIS